MRQIERDAERRAEPAAPIGEGLRRLPVDAFERQQRAHPLGGERGREAFGEGAVARKLAVAEAERGDVERAAAPALKAGQSAPRRGRGVALAIGGGQNDQPAGGAIGGREIVHRADMHFEAGAAQAAAQRLGEAPGRAALAADEQDGVGRLRSDVARHARTGAAARRPHQQAGDDEGRRERAGEADEERRRGGELARMQRVDGLIDVAPQAVVGVGQNSPGRRVERRLARRRDQRVDVGGIVGGGKLQAAQRIERRLAQSGDPLDRQARAGGGGGLRRAGPFGRRQKLEGGRRHHDAARRRQQQAERRRARQLAVQALGGRAADRREQLAPAAETSRQQREAGEAQRQHRRRAKAGGDAAGLAEQQLAVKILHRDHQRRGLGRRRARARRRIDHGLRRLVVLEIGGEDRA